MNDNKLMNRAADNIRILAASMVEKAKSGHPGGAMGGADFVNVLFSEFLIYDPEKPAWEGRDRFFLDPGHMSPMLYSQLALTGKFTIDELKEFRQWGSPTPGHPERDVMRGINLCLHLRRWCTGRNLAGQRTHRRNAGTGQPHYVLRRQ